MAAVRLLNGAYREIWQETNPALFDGGTSVTITTGLSILDATERSKCRAELHLTSVTGCPVASTPTFGMAGGFLTVTFANTAPAGNQAAYWVEVLWIHSLQQASDTAYTGTGIVVTDSTSSPPTPPSGTIRLYVDGTNGSDSNNGSSWGMAWKTYAHMEQEVGRILTTHPTSLTISVITRNGVTGPQGLFRTQGTSRCYIWDTTEGTLPAGVWAGLGEGRPEQYLDQQDWYINPTTGSDMATGLVGSPLRTWAELRRRMGKGTLRRPIRVFLLGDIAEDLVIDWQSDGQYSQTAYTIIYGTRTTVLTGHTIATAVDYDPHYPTMGYFTDAAIADWTPYTGMMFEILSGPRINCAGHIIGPVAGHLNWCRYQPMISFATGEVIYYPQAGDTFRIYTPSKVTGALQLMSGGVVQTVHMELDTSATPARAVVESCGTGNILLTACIVRGNNCQQPGGYWKPACTHFILTTGLYVADGAFLDNWGNWWQGGQWQVVNGGFCDIQGYTMVTGSIVQAAVSSGGLFRMYAPYWLCYEGTTTDKAMQILEGGIVNATAGPIWGTLAGGATVGMAAYMDGKVFYDPNCPIAITGATNQFRIGAAATYDDAALPQSTYPDGCVATSRALWANQTNVTVRGPGNSIEKTGGAADTWDVAFASDVAPIAANGFAQFTYPNQTHTKMCGLSNAAIVATFAGVEFGWAALGAGNQIQVYESGLPKGVAFAAGPGDVLRIVVVAGVVYYYQNGVLRYTSLVAPVMPLYCHVNFYTLNSRIDNVRMVQT